jgi:hypothetical protein
MDWEQDILEWVGDKQVKKMQKMTWIKFVVSVLTAVGGFGGGWYKMEQRVSKLESQLAQENKIKIIEMEIRQMKRDEELTELKYKMKVDSIKKAYEKYEFKVSEGDN